MATTYPSSKQTFTDPAGTSLVTSPDHAVLHTNINDTVEALEDTVGTTLGTNLAMSFAAGQFPVRATGGGATGTLVQTIVGGTYNNTNIGTSNILGGTLGSAFVGTPTFSSGAVPGSALTTSAITLAYTQITASTTVNSATKTAIGLAGTVTIPAGGRSVKITAWAVGTTNAVSNNSLSIWQGAVATGTQLAEALESERNAGDKFILTVMAVHTPSASLGTYNIGLANSAGSATTIEASGTSPAFIHVELV